MNTLFKKGYLLAGVIMAANMFVVNEIRATEEKLKETVFNLQDTVEKEGKEKEEIKKTEKINQKLKKKKKGESGLQSFLDGLLYWENRINFFGGIIVSCFNNYTKWWDYNPGCYGQFGCIGWKSKRFLYGVVQFEINLNLGRGAFWTILSAYNVIKGFTNNNNTYFTPLHVSKLVAVLINKKHMSRIALIGVFLIQGFASIPLTLHLFNFSISISLDSMIWAGVGKLLKAKIEEKMKKNAKDLEMAFIKNKKKEDGNNNTEGNTEI